MPLVNGVRSSMGLLAAIRLGALATGFAGLAAAIVPLLPIIITVAALAAIIIAAWKPISTFFAGLWGGLIDEAGRVSEAWTRLMDELGPVGDGIKAIFGLVGDAWSAFVSLFDTDATETGRGWATAIVDGIVAVIDGVRSVVTWWNTMVATVKEVVTISWDWLTAPFKDPFGWLAENWLVILALLLPPVGIFLWLKDTIPNAFQWVKDAWDGMLTWLAAPAVGLWDWLSETIAAPFAWVGENWLKMLGVLIPPVGIFLWLQDTFPDAFQWVKVAWDGMLTWLAAPAVNLWGWLADAIPGPFAWLEDAWDEMLLWLSAPFNGLWGWLKDSQYLDPFVMARGCYGTICFYRPLIGTIQWALGLAAGSRA